MYGHKYEYELLLSLRLMKCLHQENPAALNNALKGEDQFNEDTIPAMAEYIFWEICQNVIGNFEFMNEEDELYGDECRIETVEFTLPDISRFGVLNCKWNSLKGYPIGAWQEKFSNALGYFLGKCDSICNLECFTQGASARLKVWFSPDCCDYLEFGNALVDLLCWLQRENGRLEKLLAETEQREEAA